MFMFSVDGGWCTWEDAGECSVSCGGGLQRQTRSCTCPEPYCYGAPCDGKDERYVPCNEDCCPGKSLKSR